MANRKKPAVVHQTKNAAFMPGGKKPGTNGSPTQVRFASKDALLDKRRRGREFPGQRFQRKILT